MVVVSVALIVVSIFASSLSSSSLLLLLLLLLDAMDSNTVVVDAASLRERRDDCDSRVFVCKDRKHLALDEVRKKQRTDIMVFGRAVTGDGLWMNRTMVLLYLPPPYTHKSQENDECAVL